MVQSNSQINRGSQLLRELVKSIVLAAIRKRRPKRILLISNDAAQFPDLAGLNVITIHSGSGDPDDMVRCDTAKLPFQDDSFEIIVTHHVFSDGHEPELDEAERILTGDGELFVLGRGILGPRAQAAKTRRVLPGLKVRQVCQRLKSRSFIIEHCAGVGLMGMPVSCDRRWQRPALPFADIIVVHGRRHQSKPIVTTLRFSQAQTVGVQAAAMDSLSRAAV